MSAHEDADDFVVDQCVTVVNKRLGLDVIFTPKYCKTVEGDDYFLVDFNKNRQVFNLLSCRVPRPGIEKRIVLAAMVQMVKDLRQYRDAAFRKSVVASHLSYSTYDKGVIPRSKKLRALAYGKSETIGVTLPAVDGVANEQVVKILTPFKRSNGNTPLWMAVDPRALDYLSKVIFHGAQNLAANEHRYGGHGD